MSLTLGLQTGLQKTSMGELQNLWRWGEDAGFGWISVWDHFYGSSPDGAKIGAFEGVAAMAALAAATTRVRVGCLLFCNPFRDPGLLAKAAVTIDHISNGRAELGLGAGWKQDEFEDFGFPFLPVAQRMDRLEEALQVVRSLLRDETTTFQGNHYTLNQALCDPKPIRGRLPLWVGGAGPVRTPRLAADYGDGLNLPFLSPEDAKARYRTLDNQCEKLGRDTAEVDRSVNLMFRMGADATSAEAIRRRLEAAGDPRIEGSLLGTAPEVVERLGAYAKAGARGVNLAVGTPLDWEALEAFTSDVMPHFR